ncbi:hypothetical protein [Tahibacter amnicola]|uniref:Transposase IS200-like domain-containing protein n=1 Tax=Tahibacter amnicola TaxID=2976241 RepID=A0ABY6BH92_9GAMM|nr:hypothetical protein [Tahibacter amnicola]UXI69393.1 hypothetical protein N4264_07015 [Tahibacter amnicola]
MSYPRHHIVPAGESGYFHCISRCVRRAFLCGDDPYSGQSFEHRKQWVEDRLHELATIFAVGVYAYAVMRNHVHVVAYVAPQIAATWSAEEVAERWLRLCPVRCGKVVDQDATAIKASHIAGDPVQVARYRERLASLPWFMRCLNEPIARRANREDACTGRFWEGRYRCQALLDETAVIACMAYVDLNPIRAGIAQDLRSSEHTSIRRRLQHVGASTLLSPVAGCAAHTLGISAIQYVDLVDWTGRQPRPDKRGSIPGNSPKALQTIGLTPEAWRAEVLTIETRYWRAVGSLQALLDKARSMGQRWLKGVGLKRSCVRCS